MAVMGFWRWWCVGFLVLLLLPRTADVRAAGMRQIEDCWLIPEGSSSGSAWSLLVGQGRLFSLASLDQRFLRGRVRARWGVWHLGLQAGWGQLGAGQGREEFWYAETTLGEKSRLGLRWTRIGFEANGVPGVGSDLLWAVGERGWRLATGWDLGLRFRFPLFRRSASGGSALPAGREDFLVLSIAHQSAALAIQWDRRPSGAPALGGEVLVRGSAGWAVSLRFDLSSGALGPGIIWHRGRLVFRSSHLAHPVLGLTHRVALEVNSGGL